MLNSTLQKDSSTMNNLNQIFLFTARGLYGQLDCNGDTLTKLSLFTTAPISILVARIVNMDIQVANQEYLNVDNDPFFVGLI